MVTKTDLQKRIDELEEITERINEALGTIEIKEALDDIRTRIENADLEVPECDCDLPDVVEKFINDSVVLGAVKEALEEAGFELPENDEELAATIEEYDFTGEKDEKEND